MLIIEENIYVNIAFRYTILNFSWIYKWKYFRYYIRKIFQKNVSSWIQLEQYITNINTHHNCILLFINTNFN